MLLVALNDYCCRACCALSCFFFFCFQAEDGIRDLVRSRGLGDVYKRQCLRWLISRAARGPCHIPSDILRAIRSRIPGQHATCLLYTSDAADERSSVDLGGRRIIKKKKN